MRNSSGPLPLQVRRWKTWEGSQYAYGGDDGSKPARKAWIIVPTSEFVRGGPGTAAEVDAYLHGWDDRVRGFSAPEFPRSADYSGPYAEVTR